MHAEQRLSSGGCERLCGACANAQAAVHARSASKRDSGEFSQTYSRFCECFVYRDGHIDLVRFLRMEGMDAAERLVDGVLFQDDVGEELALGSDDRRARVIWCDSLSASSVQSRPMRSRGVERTCGAFQAEDDEWSRGGKDSACGWSYVRC